MNQLPAVKRISCWVDTANKFSLPEGMTMSESQKEYKMSRLSYSLTNTESLQEFHLEKTIVYNNSFGLLFYTEVPAKKSKELHFSWRKIHLFYSSLLKLCFPFSLDSLGRDGGNYMRSFTDGLSRWLCRSSRRYLSWLLLRGRTFVHQTEHHGTEEFLRCRASPWKPSAHLSH